MKTGYFWKDGLTLKILFSKATTIQILAQPRWIIGIGLNKKDSGHPILALLVHKVT